MVILSSIIMIFVSYFFLENFTTHKEEFYVLILSSIIGAIILIEANHMFTIFIGIELLSFPIFGLMTYSFKKNTVIQVILKYVLLSSVITSFSLFGITLIYFICGTLKLNYIKIAFLINNVYMNKILLIGVLFLLTSLFFKLSLFPLHFWVADVYQNVVPVLLIYSVTVVKIAVFSVLIKLFIYFPHNQCQVLYLLIEILSILSIVFGSIMTAFQNNIKKLFGYSSIVHIGYILTTLLVMQDHYIANEVAIIYLINYTMSSIGIFSALSLLILYNKDANFNLKKLSVYHTILKEKPILSAALIIIIFSFAGIPLTYGFITKMLILFIIIQKKFWFLLFSIIITSGFGIYYYLKIILHLYNTKNVIQLYHMKSYKIIEFFIILISIMIIIFGIFPQIIMDVLRLYNL
ncbi:NADH-quinone oxidoreductase subunit N [Buchnera aphidicola]|uniref:NADH-quinone oxidoreductase subunit N n=1 Tax=Buchnera aphidicola TaxID=9 RepID=UPI003464ADDD